MKTQVTILLVTDDPEEPLAEIRLCDPKVMPDVGDLIHFDASTSTTHSGFLGRVMRRVFHPLPFHMEVDVLAEPVD